MSNSWLGKIFPSAKSDNKKYSHSPEGLWRKCPKCESVLYRPELERNLDVCPKCDHHIRVSARKRLEMFLDLEHRVEIGADVLPEDLLKFKDTKKYRDRLQQTQKSLNETEALVVFRGELNGLALVCASFEFNFMGGSMGAAVGERFVKAVNTSMEHGIPFVCFAASGGVRMQEALFSLMQMAKTSAALEQLRSRGIPYISVMTDPVYGGVAASLAMLGDINVAEPNALIGFIGPKIIEQTEQRALPEGFQRSEFLLQNGSLDMVIHRQQLKETIHRLLCKLTPQNTSVST